MGPPGEDRTIPPTPRRAIVPAYVDHENVRLFRRDPEIYFTGRVHETVGWQIINTARRLANSQLIVHHMGMLRDAEERAHKFLFYRELGRQKVARYAARTARPISSWACRNWKTSAICTTRLLSIQRSCELNPQFGVAWFFAGVCHFRLGEFPQALACFQHAERAGHATACTAEMAGDTCYNLGDYQAAETRYRRALKRDSRSATLQSKLGLAEARGGNARAGLRRIRQAIEDQPANPDLYDRLIVVEVWLNNLSGAAESAERKLKAVPAEAGGLPARRQHPGTHERLEEGRRRPPRRFAGLSRIGIVAVESV